MKENFDFLNGNQKTAIIGMVQAVLDDKRTDEDKKIIIDKMKEHNNDLEEYAYVGFMIMTLAKDIMFSMKNENQEYKIIG